MGAIRSFSVGAFVIVPDATGILLVLHAYGKRKWSLPGGCPRQGELITAAARRETREETGLEVRLCEYPVGIFSLRKSHGFVVLFEGERVRGAVVPRRTEIAECRFVCPEEAGDLDIYPAQRGLIQHWTAWRKDNNPHPKIRYGYLIPPLEG